MGGGGYFLCTAVLSSTRVHIRRACRSCPFLSTLSSWTAHDASPTPCPPSTPLTPLAHPLHTPAITCHGSRLANYKYINMDEDIEMALKAFDDFTTHKS